MANSHHCDCSKENEKNVSQVETSSDNSKDLCKEFSDESTTSFIENTEYFCQDFIDDRCKCSKLENCLYKIDEDDIEQMNRITSEVMPKMGF